MLRQRKQALIKSDKHISKGSRGCNGQRCQRHTHRKGQRHAFTQEIFQLGVILCTVMVADNRRRADGIPDGNGNKDKLHIHQHTIGGNTILPDVLEQLKIIQHTHQRGSDIGHHLGGAVAACL